METWISCPKCGTLILHRFEESDLESSDPIVVSHWVAGPINCRNTWAVKVKLQVYETYFVELIPDQDQKE